MQADETAPLMPSWPRSCPASVRGAANATRRAALSLYPDGATKRSV